MSVLCDTEGPTGSGVIDVSLVIPCFNEEGAIARVVQKGLAGLQKLGVSGEVLVVDNGSTDGSASEARRAGARVVFEARSGYGSALMRGFNEARGRYLVMADGDDTYPVEELGPFLELLDSGYDMVNGNRFGGKMEPGAMTWSHRYLGTPALSWLLRVMTRTSLRDSQCGMRAFRREAIARLDLRAPGMEFASEMLLKATRAGLRVGEVPIALAPRIGESKLQTLPDGWRHLRYLLMASPDYLFFLPGTLLVLLGFAGIVYEAAVPQGLAFVGGIWRIDYAPVILGSAGLQILWFGVLAKVYYAITGLLGEDRVINWFLRKFSLERALSVSAAVVLSGGAVEIGLALQQFGVIPPHSVLGVIGAFAIVTGIQSSFSSFLAYLLSSEYTRPWSSTQTDPQSTELFDTVATVSIAPN